MRTIDSLVDAPWGQHGVLEEGPGFKAKVLIVAPRQRLSLQKHARRSEHWVVAEGTAEATAGGTVLLIGTGGTLYVPVSTTHRIANPSYFHRLVVFEVQLGACEENDIVRIEDDYGRVPSQ